MRAGQAAVLLAAGLVLGGCSGGSGRAPARRAVVPREAPPSSNPATTSSTDTTPTSAVAPTTTAAPATPALHPRSSPEAAAGRLLEAWAAGDRTAASEVGQPPAVDALFARAFDGVAPQARGCSEGAGATGAAALFDCFYRYGDGGLRLSVSATDGGYVVAGASYEA